MNEPKRTLPTKSLLEGGPYTPAASTDLRALFDRIRAEQQKKQAANVSTLRRKAK